MLALLPSEWLVILLKFTGALISGFVNLIRLNYEALLEPSIVTLST